MLIGLIALLVSIMAAQQIYEIYSDSCVFLESNQKSVGVSTSGGGLFSHPYYNRCFEGQIIVEGKNVEFRVINREPTVITRVVNGIKGKQHCFFTGFTNPRCAQHNRRWHIQVQSSREWGLL